MGVGTNSGRNLSKESLGSVIFGCKNNTMAECLTKKLFGLPYLHFPYVRNIEPGLTLFLFNYSDRKMHGIYEAAGSGEMNIDPNAWTRDGKGKTDFPAQVRIRIRKECPPILESQFKQVIGDNYYKPHQFLFELDHAQTEGLITLFSASDGSKSVMIAPGSSSCVYLVKNSAAPTYGVATNVKSVYSGAIEPKKMNTFQLNSNDMYIDNASTGTTSTIFKKEFTDPRAYTPVDEDTVVGQSDHQETLVQVVKELRERSAAFEKKQFESLVEIRQLRDIVEASGEQIQDLKRCVKDLEFKLMQSVGSENVIHLVGGSNGESYLSSLDIFSPTVDIMMPLKPMASARSHGSAAALNGNIYVFGGADGSSWTDTVECYSQRNNDWTLCSHLSRQKGGLAGAVLNGRIFALGGGNGSDCFSDVEIYDPAIGLWFFNQSMLQKRFSHAATELDGVLYVTGGFDGQDYLHTAERLDPRVGCWTNAPSMKTRRGGHSMAVFNEKLYVIGGFDGETKKMVPSMEIFDPRNDSWLEGEPLNLGRGFASASVLGGSLFVIGGIDDTNDFIETIERYNEGTGWSTCPHQAVGKRCYFSSVVL